GAYAARARSDRRHEGVDRRAGREGDAADQGRARPARRDSPPRSRQAPRGGRARRVVRLFRRRETLNERLLREAGLADASAEAEPAPADPPYDPFRAFRRRLDPESNAVLFRPREFETLVLAEAPELRGDELE